MISQIPDGLLRGDQVVPHLARLLGADWESEEGPLCLATDLTAEEAGASSLFADAGLFLRLVGELGPVRLTQTGNLTRNFVAAFFKDMPMDHEMRVVYRVMNKVLNEMDVHPLHVARIVCTLAGLVAKRNRKLHLTRRGQAMLDAAESGTFYRRLFITFFRKLNLNYVYPMRDVPGIQHTLPLILLALGQAAREWADIDELAGVVLPLPVLDDLRARMGPYEKEGWILAGYVLRPLEGFGLIQFRAGTREPKVGRIRQEVRLTPLWDRFLRFDLPPGVTALLRASGW